MRIFLSLILIVLCTLSFGGCTAPSTPEPARVLPQATAIPTDLPAPATAPATNTPIQVEPRQPLVISPVGMDGVLVTGTSGQPWWNDTVFYEIFVRSFLDSDGDGVGDLKGLIEKLDYLNDGDPGTHADLGVTGIWLMPIAQSPSYHGYDVVDYYQVDDEYGTNDDFRLLMAEAHRRGIRVIVDLVLNHTSSEHPWFVASQDPTSPQRDWYVWANEQPQAKGWHPGQNGDFYYGYFWDGMPDLNFNNPAVTEEMLSVVRFWLEEMGVDGFRLDAVKYLYEDGSRIEHLPATHEWLQAFRAFYKAINPQAFTVGEVWSDTSLAARYVGAELDTVFEFNLADTMIQSALSGRKVHVERGQANAIQAYPPGQFATFLANHDQPRVRSRLLEDAQAKTAASLQLLFSGVPFIYYGEEIGMQGSKPDENIRRPMQWTPEGGFTDGIPWRPYFDDYATRHVAGQDADESSILSHYRSLIRLRNNHEALRIGSSRAVQSDHAAVYSSLRASEDETILVLLNLGSQPVSEYGLTLEEGPLTVGLQPVLLMGASGALYAPLITTRGGFDNFQPIRTLAPQSTYVFQLLP